MSLIDIDLFEKMGNQHTEKDRKIDWEGIKMKQKRLTGLCRGISKALGVGENWGDRNVGRVRDCYHTLSGITPVFTTMPKDHKEMSGEVPPNRPLCKASTSSCMNGRLSDILTDLLTPIAKEKGVHTCKSTEGMLHNISETNKILRRAGDKKFILASQDVKALYPSLHIGESAEIVRQAVESSEVEIEGRGKFPLDTSKESIHKEPTENDGC